MNRGTLDRWQSIYIYNLPSLPRAKNKPTVNSFYILTGAGIDPPETTTLCYWRHSYGNIHKTEADDVIPL